MLGYRLKHVLEQSVRIVQIGNNKEENVGNVDNDTWLLTNAKHTSGSYGANVIMDGAEYYIDQLLGEDWRSDHDELEIHLYKNKPRKGDFEAFELTHIPRADVNNAARALRQGHIELGGIEFGCWADPSEHNDTPICTAYHRGYRWVVFEGEDREVDE